MASLTGSFRFRVMAALAGLAVVPFALAGFILFRTVRADVQESAGRLLAADAAMLAGELEGEFARMAAFSGRAARLVGESPDAIAAIRALDETVADAVLLPSGEAGGLILRADSNVETRTPAGSRTLAITFSPRDVHSHLSHFRAGTETVAMLLVDGKIIASSRPGGEAVPTVVTTASPWFRYKAGSAVWYGAATEAPGAATQGGAKAKILVAAPEKALLEDFNYAATRASAIFATLAFVLLAGAWRLTGRMLKPLSELRQGAEIVSRINLSHRISVTTGDELELLAADFNRMAEALQNAYGGLEKRVDETTASLRVEKNRLAAILRTMSEGVVVTNGRGETLLMNPRARAALSGDVGTGVGADLRKLLPAARLDFHLRRVGAARRKGVGSTEPVIFTTRGGRTLRGALTTLTDPGGSDSGYLLVFRDVTADAAHEERTQRLLGSLPDEIKRPVASLRALASILLRRGDLDHERQKPFLAALKEEAVRAADALAGAEKAVPDLRYLRWPISSVEVMALVDDLVAEDANLFAVVEPPSGRIAAVAVEAFGWLCVMSTALKWLGSKAAPDRPVGIRIAEEDEFVTVTYRLEGPADIDPGEIDRLMVEPPGEPPVPIREAVARNRAGLWARKSDNGFEVRLAMSRSDSVPRSEEDMITEGSTPGFYDFDLFLPRHGVEREEQLSASLFELEFAVFDTETTGLNIGGGDRMVSISGVKVRGGKVIGTETFDLLVNPGVPIPPAATAIHGISDRMVADAPLAAEALARFGEWIGDAVLVAHNAAFDARLLAAESKRAGGEPPVNTILDTLLLSHGIAPGEGGHSIEALCLRFGIPLLGRHTSKGDALATARIFAAILPLLEARGVRTLADAKAFCDRMLLRKWQASRY